MTSKPITVQIFDPDRLFREGLKQLVRKSKSRINVIGAGKYLPAAFAESPETNMVVCTVDEASGTELARLQELRFRHPGIKFVALASALLPQVFARALQAGVDAFLSKDISPEVLERSLELVMLGQQFFPSGFAQLLLDRPLLDRPIAKVEVAVQPQLPERGVSLSEREREILDCLVAGLSNKEIGRELDIAEATVKVHVKALLRKVHATNRTQAAVWALSKADDPKRDVGERRTLNPITRSADRCEVLSVHDPEALALKAAATSQ
jgi:two-component system, NarL family, nitrate/nitrite response regulator NarL